MRQFKENAKDKTRQRIYEQLQMIVEDEVWVRKAVAREKRRRKKRNRLKALSRF